MADPAPNALPSNGIIASGTGAITQSSGNMQINQQSQQLITNWDSFNIGRDAQVTFNQPDSSSVALNRVHSASPSQVFGKLNANGRVFLLNSAGILFGETARVDVGGLVASSGNLSDSDFNRQNYQFKNIGSGASINNTGQIMANALAFIAPKISNTGTINTPNGTTAFLAGDEMLLDFSGDDLIRYSIDKGTADALIENSGSILAEQGLVALSAKGLQNVNSSVVNHSGIINSKSLVEKGGRVLLLADDVTVEETAVVDTSGAMGGGEILVGGSWQNNDSNIQQATRTIVKKGAKLLANGLDQGSGGTVVVWSDVTNDAGYTFVQGTIEATGGLNGGDGGNIETSGYFLNVDEIELLANAPLGLGGNWLLDPANITINNAGSTTAGSSPLPNYESSSNTTVIDRDDIEAQLDLGTNVTIQTGSGTAGDGDILVNADIAKTAGGDATLRLNAHRYIRLNQGISSSSNKLNVILNSDIDDNGGRVFIHEVPSINTNGGDFSIVGGSSGTGYATGSNGGSTVGIIVENSTINTAGGNVLLKGKGWSGGGAGIVIYEDSEINASGGDITIEGIGVNSKGIAMTSNTVDAIKSTKIFTAGSGDINLTGSVVSTSSSSNALAVDLGKTDVNSGVLIQTDDGNITINGIAGEYSPGDANDETNVSGVDIARSTVETLGNGNINITGTGATANAGDGGDRDGLNIEANSLIQTGNGVGGIGAITLIGNANGRGEGIDMEDTTDSSIISGSGGVSITGTNTTGASIGLDLAGIISAIAGDIVLIGTGGDGSDIASSSNAAGIGIKSLTLGSTSTNSISINGTAKSADNIGVDIDVTQSTFTTSASGDISITGSGQGTGAGVYSDKLAATAGSGGLLINGTGGIDGTGVFIFNNTTLTTNAGDINITGTVSNDGDGIQIWDDTTITANSADITINGTGGTSNGDGVYIDSDIAQVNVQATGAGNITITGNSTTDGGIETENSSGGLDTVIQVSTGNIVFNGITAANASGQSGMELTDVDIISDSGNVSLTGRSGGSSSLGIDWSEGDVDISSNTGDITLVADSADFEGSSNTTQSSGQLIIKPYSTNSSISLGGTSGNLSISNDNFGDEFVDGFSAIQIGASNQTGGIVVEGDIDVPDNLELLQGNGDIDINSILTLSTNSDTLTLNTLKGSQQSAGSAIIATILNLLGSGANHVLNIASASSGNDVAILAADTGQIDYADRNALSIGTANTTTGITATGTIKIVTKDSNVASDLSITQDISTTDTTVNAIWLNAGEEDTAGHSSLIADRADIKYIAGDITTGTGGRASLFSGSIAGTSALATKIANDGFRYASDESTVNYTLPLAAGLQLIYREQPSVTIQAIDDSKVYDGLAYSGGNGVSYTGFMNTDNSNSLSGTINYGSNSQGAINVGSYIVSASGLSDSLGYALNYANGQLNVTKAPLNIKATDVTKSFDNVAYTATDGVEFSGFVNGDSVAQLTGSAIFNGNAIGAIDVGSYSIVPSGYSATNYNISFTDGSLTILDTTAPVQPPIVPTLPPTEPIIDPIITPSINQNGNGLYFGFTDSNETRSGVEFEPVSVQVVVYRQARAPIAEKGFKVSEQKNSFKLEPIDEVEQGFSNPGSVSDLLTFSAQADNGEKLPFTASITKNGIVIEPLTALGLSLIESNRDLIIGNALYNLKQGFDLSPKKVRTVYLKLDKVADQISLTKTL